MAIFQMKNGNAPQSLHLEPRVYLCNFENLIGYFHKHHRRKEKHMTTGEKISKLRKENNYTQEQLAELLGVSRQSISKYESDMVFPETEKLIRLSDLFGCTVDYLLKENVEKENGFYTSGDAGKSDREVTLGSLVKKYHLLIRKANILYLEYHFGILEKMQKECLQ